jgi:alkanesulfonate monooxygenase SsuD/methylene tetrahydromethanopterin reductase-like flavin-dependent oxidoreductase (luciferase family)
MRLALNLNYSGASVALDIDKVLEAERLGYTSVWTAEAYGSDAVTPAAWIAARTTRIDVGTGIMQIPARTPAMTAMTAMTLDAL